MGTKPSKLQLSTELSHVNSEAEDYYQEYFELKDCCGYKYKRSVKSSLIWETNFIKNCSELRKAYAWADLMSSFVKSKKISRIKYIREFNDLKFQQQCNTIPERKSLLSGQEIKDFKENLKKSVLISFAGAKNQQIPKNAQVLQSVIINPTHNYIRKKNQYLEQFNRSTIVKENQRCSRISQGESVKEFIDDTMGTIFRNDEEQISRDKAYELQIFMKFTILLEKHLNDKDNKLYYVIQIFCESLFQRYPVKKTLNLAELEELVNQIKIFLVLLRNAVEDFYNTRTFYDLDEKCNHLITNSENILTTVTAILFKNAKFYDHIFKIFQQYNFENEAHFKKIMESLSQKGPEFFEVGNSYCLNKFTVTNYIQTMSVQSMIQDLHPEQLESNNEQPYHKCIEILQKLHKSRTPISKMKIIMECSDQITQSIAHFYQHNGMDVKQKVLDADQVLSIFCYIIAKSKVNDLHTHLLMLENFATEHQLISAAGYYYSVISAALEQVQTTYCGFSDK